MLLTEESFAQIKTQLNSGADAINPYTNLIDLQSHETEALINGKNALSLDQSESQLNRQHLNQFPPFCGGVFAISLSLYQQCGGFDERFCGWGAEDNAMSMRLAHFAKQPVTLSGQYAYHLWHPSALDDSAQRGPYLNNLARLSTYHENGHPFYADLARMDAEHNADIHKLSKLVPKGSECDKRAFISCLCVTRMRIEALKRAIECYQQQSHPDRELLVLCEDDDHQTIEFLQTLDNPQIRGHIVPVQPRLTLGELRNRAIAAAKGDYICQWDDDDWYHPRRLELQLKTALGQNKAASILPRWLIYSRLEHAAYCSNVRLWEGSLLCRKALLQSGPGYPAISKGEDTAVIAWLYVQDELAIEDRPDLYVYMHSGNNTWEDRHFKQILDSSTALSPKDTEHLRVLLKIPSAHHDNPPG